MGEILKEDNGITYIHVTADDGIAGCILALETECFSDAWSLENIKSQLAKSENYSVAALHDGKMLGVSSMQHIFDEGEILRICVSENYRGRGIAGNMMELLDSEMKNVKLSACFLEVREDNIPAISLYEKFGFEKIAVRKNYYGDCDGIVMKKEL